MELFKNSVGRPSNEIKKKRRNFIIAIILVCVMVIGGLSYLVINNSSKIKKNTGGINISYAVDAKIYGDYYYYKVDAGLILMKFNSGTAEAGFFPMGDINFDGFVTEEDARIALRVSARLDSINNLQMWNADLNHDGKIIAKEARSILQQSKNPNGYKQYKVCLSEEPTAKDCKWNILSANSYNQFKNLSSSSDYFVFLYDVKNKKVSKGYWPVTFNGKGKKYINIENLSKSTGLKVGKSATIEVETNSKTISQIGSSNSKIVSIKMKKKMSNNFRRYEITAKKAGTVEVYVKSSDGVKNTIKFTVAENYIRATSVPSTSQFELGKAYEIEIETNSDNTIKDMYYDGKILNVTLLEKISNSKRKYRIVATGTGKSDLTFKSSNGKSVKFTYNVIDGFKSPDNVFGKNNYNINTSSGVKIYSDKSCNSTYVNNYINVMKKLPGYAKRSVGRIDIISDSRAVKLYGSGWAGVTACDGAHISLLCSYGSNSELNAGRTIIHEVAHAVDCRYLRIKGEQLSSVFNYNGVYERAKNKFYGKVLTETNNYAMSSPIEFFAQAYVAYIWKYDSNFKYSVKTVNNAGFTTELNNINIDGYTKYALDKIKW